MDINQYKKKYSKNLTKQDSLNFLIKDKDTLVLIKNFKPNGIGVPFEFRDSIFLDIYKDVVFQSHTISRNKDKTIKYWKESIKLFFDKSVSKREKEEFLKFSSYISREVDSLNIYEVKDKKKANYYVYEINDKFQTKFDNRIHNSDGAGYYVNWDGRQRFYKCNFEINRKIIFNDALSSKIVREIFFKSLGYFHSTELLSCDHILSNCYNGNKNLNILDLEILKYHYSYGICKGVNIEIFEETNKKAKESLKKGTRIKIIN